MHSLLKYQARLAGIFLALAMLWSTSYIFSQPKYPMTEYSTENGLSLNSVNDLLFDKQGFLWIATADGLQKFDGYRFQTFRHDPQNKKSLPENSVSVIYEDDKGNLWITERAHIVFKPKGKIEFIDLTPSLPNFAFKFPLYTVGETDSTVLIINYPDGIYTVNKTTLNIKKTSSFEGITDHEGIFLHTRQRSKDESSWFIKGTDKTGDLYSITPGGIRRFDNRNREKLIFLIPEKKDSLLIVTDRMAYKAAANDPFAVTQILPSTFNAAGFDNNFMTPRKVGPGRYFLIGTKEIWLYDAGNQKITAFPFEDYFSPELIRYLHVTATDSHDNSWLGYNGIGGIKVISPKKFGLFERPGKNALPYSLAADGKGRIYAGIYLGDIEVYDKEGRFLQTIKLPEADKKFGSPRAMAMIDSSTLIVKSLIDRLYAIDISKGSVQLLNSLLPPNTDSVLGEFEFGMQQIRDGELWFSYRSSIFSIVKNVHAKNRYTSRLVCTLPQKEKINNFFRNDKGQLWIGTVAGVWCFEKNGFQKIPLPPIHVKHINQHAGGKIWITTMDGVFILKDKRLVKQLNVKDGLPNSFVYAVLFDDTGNAWVSTNRGLAKIDSNYGITSYSSKEGLQGDEFNTRGYCKTTDGTLYFAGVNGINFFKPERLLHKGEASQTMLTDIEVNNQPYLPGMQPEFINTINLSYRQNNIRLAFACMDLTVPEKNRYRFWLKGFQNDWTQPQTNNTVQYILPPGDYELHVLGANYEGVWSKEPLIVRINILPPWYQTRWARIVFTLLVLGMVGGVFYYISRTRYQKKLRTLQMEQEVQKEKQRLSRDLHDNLGAQITWLQNNITQVDQAQQQQQPVEHKINRLREGAGELMQTLRETIWILNKDKISCIDLFDKLVNHAAKYVEATPELKLHTEENITGNFELASGQALQIFRICQEAIHNACKHAGASLLNISAQTIENKLSICISDDGKGFDTRTENPGHYGLQNMRQRAAESELQLNMESLPGKGTSISITAIM